MVAVEKQFSYEPERLADDLYAIPLPLHDGSPVNVYVAIGDDGVWLIDGGLGTERCQNTLRSGLESLGYGLADIRGLVITHGHTDHVGVAEAVLAAGGEVLAHRLETSSGRRLAFDESWLRLNGLPADRVGHDAWSSPVWPAPTRLLEDGDRLRLGNLDLEVVWCPGHTPGLVCLYEPRRRVLFTTDHVMRRAMAPVSVRHDDAANPLREYLDSVRKLEPLAVETVLPGHGRPFQGLRQRLEHIQVEIQHQLDQVLERLAAGPTTAYQLLSVHALRDRRPVAARYSISLVLARLRYLEELGRVHRITTDRSIHYAVNS
ncbi:MAG TPA: MBL fold metallo-hydrolase [Chloroflexota bacterium]